MSSNSLTCSDDLDYATDSTVDCVEHDQPPMQSVACFGDYAPVTEIPIEDSSSVEVPIVVEATVSKETNEHDGAPCHVRSEATIPEGSTVKNELANLVAGAREEATSKKRKLPTTGASDNKCEKRPRPRRGRGSKRTKQAENPQAHSPCGQSRSEGTKRKAEVQKDFEEGEIIASLPKLPRTKGPVNERKQISAHDGLGDKASNGAKRKGLPNRVVDPKKKRRQETCESMQEPIVRLKVRRHASDHPSDLPVHRNDVARLMPRREAPREPIRDRRIARGTIAPNHVSQPLLNGNDGTLILPDFGRLHAPGLLANPAPYPMLYDTMAPYRFALGRNVFRRVAPTPPSLAPTNEPQARGSPHCGRAIKKGRL